MLLKPASLLVERGFCSKVLKLLINDLGDNINGFLLPSKELVKHLSLILTPPGTMTALAIPTIGLLARGLGRCFGRGLGCRFHDSTPL